MRAILWVFLGGLLLSLLAYILGFSSLMTGSIQWAFGLSALSLVLGIAVVGIFIWAMLLDCLRRPFPNETERLLYTALIILLVPIGALVYYARVVRRAPAAE